MRLKVNCLEWWPIINVQDNRLCYWGGKYKYLLFYTMRVTHAISNIYELIYVNTFQFQLKLRPTEWQL